MSCHVCTYLGSKSKPSHPVPCGNNQSGWTEVTRGWKQLLNFITGSLEKSRTGCLPVENGSKLPDIHIVPERSNQWRTKEWKPLWGPCQKSRTKCEMPICVHLQIRIITSYVKLILSTQNKNQANS